MHTGRLAPRDDAPDNRCMCIHFDEAGCLGPFWLAACSACPIARDAGGRCGTVDAEWPNCGQQAAKIDLMESEYGPCGRIRS